MAIRIKVSYLDKKLRKLAGKKEEEISMLRGARSGDFIDLLIEKYPAVFEKFGPGYLGFTRNGKKPNVLTLLKNGDHYKFTIWTDEEILEDELAKRLKKSGAVMELPYDLKMPKWMDCTWRRDRCGKDECRICGEIKKDRQRHIERGEDPDSIESAFQDVGRNLAEAMRIARRNVKKLGIDVENIWDEDIDIERTSEPQDFPLYNQVAEWRKGVHNFAQATHEQEDPWLLTEEAEDLLWYCNTLCAKVYRQLCNKWHIERGDEYTKFDYDYTKWVLGECMAILEKSLSQLSVVNTDLVLPYAKLIELKEEVEKI